MCIFHKCSKWVEYTIFLPAKQLTKNFMLCPAMEYRQMNTNNKVVFSSIKKEEFNIFMKKFKEGKFGTQRLGQAFYNNFNMHKATNQEELYNLHAKDGEHALNLIRQIFHFS